MQFRNASVSVQTLKKAVRATQVRQRLQQYALQRRVRGGLRRLL